MSEEVAELLQAVARVVSAFEALGVDYLVGGSVASSGRRNWVWHPF